MMRINTRCGGLFVTLVTVLTCGVSARAAIVTSFELAASQTVVGFTTYNLFADTGTFDWTNSRIEVALSTGSLNHVLGGVGGSQPLAEAQTLGDSGVIVPSGFLSVASHLESSTTLETSWFNTVTGDTGKNQIGLLTISNDANGTITGRSISPELVGGTTFDFTITNGAIDGVTPPALVGDYDGSGDVGQSDLNLVLAFWGAAANDGQAPAGAATWVNADDVTASIIGQDELARVLQNWGNTSAIAAELAAIADATGLSDDDVRALIPEPTTVAIVMFGGLAMLRRR